VKGEKKAQRNSQYRKAKIKNATVYFSRPALMKEGNLIQIEP
jgi:hypothetical protein